jgi:hypothetical protein
MTLELRRRLDEADMESVEIHMSDDGTLEGGIHRARAFKKDEEVWDTIDYAASHFYDYQNFFTRPDEFDERIEAFEDVAGDKPFLSTELAINDEKWQRPTYRMAFAMGQLYHNHLALADASAINSCWTLLTVVQPSYGWTRSLMVPDREHQFVPTASSHQLRVFGAFSRRIKEGMDRIGAASPDDDLLVSAYAGENGTTVVVVNRSTAPKRVHLEGLDEGFRYRETVDPYSENEIASEAPPFEGGVTTLTVDPGAIVTVSDEPLGALPEEFEAEIQ